MEESSKKCVLCLSVSRRFSTITKRNKETTTWVERMSGQTLLSGSLICNACDMYIHQHKGEECCDHWVKGATTKIHNKSKCNVEGCKQYSTICSKKI